MSSAVIALPLAAPAKSPKKRARSTKKKTGPTVSDLILKAMSVSKERGGTSLAALKKALKAGGYDVVKNKARIVTAIKRLVANKSLVQTKGSGAAGSFKLNKKPPKPRKKKVVKKKKPKAKKVRKSRAKKAGGTTPAKKSPKRKRKAKSPKKAKRPAGAKKPRKPRSPKKTKRKAARSTRTRTAAKK